MLKKSTITVALFLGLSGSLLAGSNQTVVEPSGAFPPDQFAKVAVVQYNPHKNAPLDTTQDVVDVYKQSVLDDLDGYIREAAKHGAKLVVTPEMGTVGYPDIPELPSAQDDFRHRRDIRPYVETIDGKTTQHFTALSKELGIYLIFGFAEIEPTSEQYFNTIVASGPHGEIVKKYHKIHLHGNEKNYFSAGNERAFFDTEFGRIGMIICYDLKAKEPSVNLVNMDHVDALVFPTSWVWGHAMNYFRLFAAKNKVYLLAANNTYFPDSGVINPDGSLQSFIHDGKGVTYGYLPYLKKK